MRSKRRFRDMSSAKIWFNEQKLLYFIFSIIFLTSSFSFDVAKQLVMNSNHDTKLNW